MELWGAGDCQRFVHFDTAYRITLGKALQMVSYLLWSGTPAVVLGLLGLLTMELWSAGDCQHVVHL